jgi:lipopolysaccharide/colanic/teichoic acid biosynthesis glycosyltransferase
MAASHARAAMRSNVARLIVLRRERPRESGSAPDLLEYALFAAPLHRIVLDALGRSSCSTHNVPSQRTIWAVPQEWRAALPGNLGQIVVYTDAIDVESSMLRDTVGNSWLAISDGRFVCRMNREQLELGLAKAGADAVAVMADPELSAYHERVRLTHQRELVGYRRLYRDSMEPIPMPADWPHEFYVRGEAALVILKEGLPGSFQAAVERLRACGCRVESIAVAGSSVDLRTEEGLLSLAAVALAGGSCRPLHQPMTRERGVTSSDGNGGLSPQSRFIGPVLLGEQVCVKSDAVIIGPTILCDRSTVGAGAVVDACIVGVHSEVAPDQVVRHSIVRAPGSPSAGGSVVKRTAPRPGETESESTGSFRTWPRFSYAGCFKRVVDVVGAAVVLVLFAPIIPFIALAIKTSSPGPTFFRDKRQGLHGKPFSCFKFRTMRAGADRLQDKLRFISEVDGPQFKMVDDPRITTVGRFLRETYLDEIPQFYNVLRGDMSVVGPRPSPESENTLCPWWRDARLSVRPGITGLWQICRTREPMKDFQEWIHYDTRYVRDLSWRLDLWICWRTFKRMVANFINQF